MSTIPIHHGLLAVLAAAAVASAQDATEPDAARAAFHTYSQRAWGDLCATDDTPACWLEARFASLFPDGLVLGDRDGDDGDGEHALVFTSADAVAAFLPVDADAPTATLDATSTDPASGARGHGGALAGELLAAKLNVLFDARGLMPSTSDGTSLGELVFVDGVADALVDRSVRDVIALADGVLAGRDGLAVETDDAATASIDVDGDGEPDLSALDLVAALAAFNGNYANGQIDAGALSPPVRPLSEDGSEPEHGGGR